MVLLLNYIFFRTVGNINQKSPTHSENYNINFVHLKTEKSIKNGKPINQNNRHQT